MTKYEQLSRERKASQKRGDTPEWLTTGGYQLLTQKYLDGQTVRQRYQEIANTAAMHMPDDRLYWSNRFFQLFWKGHLAASTPVLANMGRPHKGMPVSCTGNYVEDSIDGFYDAYSEIATLTKNGFGTSSYLGDVRPRGAEIATGGKASGVIDVISSIVDDMRKVSQGTSRRGAWAGYYPLNGGDFYEVADYLLNHPDDLNIGWNIYDDDIIALQAGDKDLSDRFARMLKIKLVTGKGYLFFPDRATAANPVDMEPVLASNLCVSPETVILTDKGYLPIHSLEGKEVNVWNGEEWSPAVVVRTAENVELVKVNSAFLGELECTPEHKFILSSGKRVAAKDLKPGDKLIKFDLPTIEGTRSLGTDARLNGFYSADGTTIDYGRHKIYLYGEKDVYRDYVEDYVGRTMRDNANRLEVEIPRNMLESKYFVPTAEYTIKERLDWFAGYLDGDGTVARNGVNESLQCASTNEGFLREVQLMLQTLGVHSKLTVMHRQRKAMLPDGKGGQKLYDCKKCFRLLISSVGTYQLQELGLHCMRLNLSKSKPQRDARRFDTITSVEYTGRISDTFCFTEHKRNMGMFNGMLTGQCSEIMLPSNAEMSFTCVLSSMNLAKYNEWKDTDAVYVATLFLDCVAEEFLKQAKGRKNFERTVKFTEEYRALGLGTLGFHTYLQQESIVYGSVDSMLRNKEIFSRLKRQANEASVYMGKLKGIPSGCINMGRRNSHLIAVAPNTSSALICGGVSQGIEPVVANLYNQQTAAGDIYRVNPVFLELAKSYGQFTPELVKELSEETDGSVQHLDWLSPHEKAVFATAYELDQLSLIRMASARQPDICQGQSFNLFADADESEIVVKNWFKHIVLDPNFKAQYYLRTKAGVKGAKADSECVACEG